MSDTKRRVKAAEKQLGRRGGDVVIRWINDGDPRPDTPADQVIKLKWINTPDPPAKTPLQ